MVNTRWIAEDLGIIDLVTFVPYDGGAQARPALLGNHVQLLSGASGDIRALVDAGDAFPIIVMNDRRIDLLPNTPAAPELNLGVTNFVARTMWAPPGTPSQIVSYLENAFRRVTEMSEFQADMRALGVDVRYIDSAGTRNLIREWASTLEPRFARLE
jgi:tripartite-type tricarboxylate transporter receptor subunit TctC